MKKIKINWNRKKQIKQQQNDMRKIIDNLKTKYDKEPKKETKEESLEESEIKENDVISINDESIHESIQTTSLEENIKDNKIPKNLSVPDLDVQDMQTQTALDKAFSELFSQINLEKKTEFLKNSEIKKLGTLFTMAKKYGFIALQERIVKHMEMRISLKRKGRKEAVEMIKAERRHEEMKSVLEKYTRNET